MLSHVSLSQYGIFMGIALSVYYLLVLIFYYHKELGRFFKGNKRLTALSSFSAVPSPVMGNIQEVDSSSNYSAHPSGVKDVSVISNKEPAARDLYLDHKSYEEEAEQADTYEELASLMAGLKRIIKVNNSNTTWSDIMDGIQRELNDYSKKLNLEEYKLELNAYLIKEFLENRSLRLQVADLEPLWSEDGT